MIIDIEATLTKMHERDMICFSSIAPIIATYGKSAKVGKRTLMKALKDRGTVHFRRFFQVALNWDADIVEYLADLDYRTRYGNLPRKKQPLSEREDAVRRAHIAFVLTWIKEINKP